MTPADISMLAAEIVKLMPPPIPIEVAMWDGDMIALYMRRNARTVKEKVVMHPTFPKPYRITANAHPLWKASEVIEWVEQHKEK